MMTAVVVPALNEEATIAEVVEAVRSLGTAVVVDDGSSDATGRVAVEAGGHVVRHERNLGYDRALASGMRAALALDAAVIATVDADGEQLLDGLAEAVAAVGRGDAVVALGIRPSAGRISERIFGRYVQRRFGPPDILCGVKVYDARFVAAHESLLDRPTIGTGIALAALRERQPHLVFTVPVRARRPSRFGRGLRPNLKIGRALLDALCLDLRSIRRG